MCARRYEAEQHRRVKVQNGEVTLSGTVGERQCRRMAEEIAECGKGDL
jgi:osmotically-inducible protein OsmY